MSVTLQIKRSTGTAAPSSLANGELAYTQGTGTQGNLGDRLFIGDGSSVNVIGGQYFGDMLDHVAGTLTASGAIIVDSNKKIDELIVDDVNINGKVITMTGSTSDTAVFTAGTNGTLSIVTTDDAAAAANIQITADGTAELAGTTVTLDSGGGITLDADGGTITFADGGVSLGTITSSGYTGNVVGNTSGTAATVTTAAQTNITSLGTLTALTVDDVVIDGKVVTMTGSTSDTAVFTAGTNGTLSIVTTDAAAAAANITITADGTFEADGTTVTLDSAGDIVLDADGGDVFFKDAGTTFGSATNTAGNLIVKSGTTTALTFSGANVTAAGTIGSGAITSTGVVTGTGFTIGSAAILEAELEILDGATVTTTELNLLDGGTSVGASITLADADGFIVNDAGTMKSIPASDIKTYTGGSAADELTVGDAAVTITTSSGNITIDAAANDSDIIFKGTDATADITMLTLDGSEAGAAIFNSAITGGGLLTTGGNIVIPNAGNIGSAGDTDAIAIASDGVVTFSQNPVGTLATAAQTNITSLGTLTALTVDDVVIDGKVVTMTGSTSDTAVFTAGTNGTLSIVTTDAAAAAANIQITADGTAELAGTTVTLDSSGGITLDADGGTITFADAGSSLGTITSSGFTGNVVGNVTGNTSGTALTVTQAAQTAITSVGTLNGLAVAGSQTITMGSNRVTNVADPTSAQDAASKAYVDAVKVGLDVKDSVVAASTGNGTLASAFANSSTLDGVTLATNDRILLKDQSTGAENGIYTVNSSGAPTRATDFDADSEVTSGAFTFVTEGTANGDSGFVLTTNDDITVGTTAMTFAQFSGAGQITAGSALTKSGNTLNVGVDDSSIEVNSDALRVKASGITNAMLAGSIDLTGKVTGTLPIGNGGTGLTAAAKGTVIVANSANTLSALDGGGSNDGILAYTASADTIAWATTVDGGTF